MLKNIDPLLNADILYALRAMGHGDTVVIADANFPADAVARQTTLGKVLRIDGVDAARATQAVLSVMPLDTFVEDAALCMAVVGKPSEVPEARRPPRRDRCRRRQAASAEAAGAHGVL
jgi:L-fucose mutarotase